MIQVISILLIITSVLLVLVVLMQNSKGGVADGFSGTTQLMGARRTGDLLTKLTSIFAIIILVLTLAFNFIAKPTDDLSIDDIENTDDADADASDADTAK
jgi:preprotein translocase subunit SecG